MRRMRGVRLGMACAAFVVASGAAQAADCLLSKSTPWAAAGKGYEIDGLTAGPDCAKAAALIVIRDGDLNPVWTEAFNAAQIQPLSEAKTPAEMDKALTGWIDPKSSSIHTSADFPEWKKGADSPAAGEFPFTPDSGLDRDSYEAIRARKLPAFCYVQGMESLSCVVADPQQGGVVKVGIQAFPG